MVDSAKNETNSNVLSGQAQIPPALDKEEALKPVETDAQPANAPVDALTRLEAKLKKLEEQLRKVYKLFK